MVGKQRGDSQRLVFVGPDGDVYRAARNGASSRLTCGWFDEDSRQRVHYVWPTFSPDGRAVACFGLRPGESIEAALYAVDDDGVRMREVWSASEALPICESWSHDSRHIALLFQRDNRLALEVADLAHPGTAIAVEHVAPLFWAWSPTQNILAVHSGGSHRVEAQASLSLYCLDGGFERIACLQPGDFRTPAWSPDGRRLAYVDTGGRHDHLAMYRIDDGASEFLYRTEGSCAMLWSPDGSMLAIAQALDDHSNVYVGLTLVDVRTGRTDVVSDRELIGFFWSPCSTRLAIVVLDEERGMRWSVFDRRGSTLPTTQTFYPTNDFVYFCQFFDQFASSHPLISPDGRSLVFAGYLSAPGDETCDDDSSVYVLPIDESGEPERLARGHFACWESDRSRTRLPAC